MNKQVSLILATSVAIVAWWNLCGLAQAKSVSMIQHEQANHDRDPMLALPSSPSSTSGRQEQHQPPRAPAMIEQQQARPTVEVQYVYANGQSVSFQQELPAQDDTTNGQGLKEFRHMSGSAEAGDGAQLAATTDGAPYQMIQISGVGPSHNHDGIDCNKRHEYTSLISVNQQEQPSAPSEYPGEIIYVDQNGEATYNSPQNTGSQTSESSSLAATILTEVPINHMPPDVLEKLKRDYGVRVVATRERPGANLVINCDEHNNQPGSICNRNQGPSAPATLETLAEHQSPGGPYPVYPRPQYTLSSPPSDSPASVTSGEEHYSISGSPVEHHHYEQPEHNQDSSHGAAVIENQTTYLHRSGVTSPSAESPEARAVEYVPTIDGANNYDAQGNNNDDRASNESYGARTTSPMNSEHQVEAGPSVAPNSEQVNSHSESSSEEQQQHPTEGSVDSEGQDSNRGFDQEQAKGDGEPAKESGEQVYSSRQ